jgi:ubiquinone/menaquinone biosynthesis C-methylase UbiE
MLDGSIVDHFDERSDSYGQAPSWVNDGASLRAVIEAVLATQEAPPASVLDLGTGTGAMGAALAAGLEPVPALTCVDSSLKMLAHSETGSVAVADAHRLPFRDGAFDLVAMRQVFHYLDRPGVALAEISRTLGARGRFVVSQIVPFDDALDTRYWRRSVALRQPLRRHGWTAHELRAELEGAGFQILTESTFVARGSLTSWLDRYSVEDETAASLRAHFATWADVDSGVRRFRHERSDITYDLRWVILVGRAADREL